MAVFVGTSGWQYRDWRGALYPSDLAQGGWLEYYAARFGTVENNGSFYRLPGAETFARWRARTPAGFVMGIPFPTGLRLLEMRHAPSVRWAWSLNAAASVLGSVGAVVLALYLGIVQTLLVGGALYLIAALVAAISPVPKLSRTAS